jgi:hypothetical protein
MTKNITIFIYLIFYHRENVKTRSFYDTSLELCKHRSVIQPLQNPPFYSSTVISSIDFFLHVMCEYMYIGHICTRTYNVKCKCLGFRINHSWKNCVNFNMACILKLSIIYIPMKAFLTTL